MMRLGTKLVLTLGFALISTTECFGQWTHSVQNNPVHNQDIAFDGNGVHPNSWIAQLYHVTAVSGMEQETYREQDTGTVDTGGIYAGEYKRNERSPVSGNWNYIQGSHRSKLYVSNVVVATVNFSVAQGN